MNRLEAMGVLRRRVRLSNQSAQPYPALSRGVERVASQIPRLDPMAL